MYPNPTASILCAPPEPTNGIMRYRFAKQEKKIRRAQCRWKTTKDKDDANCEATKTCLVRRDDQPCWVPRWQVVAFAVECVLVLRCCLCWLLVRKGREHDGRRRWGHRLVLGRVRVVVELRRRECGVRGRALEGELGKVLVVVRVRREVVLVHEVAEV